MARDVAQTISQPPVTSDPDADSHAAGIWSVYVSEAEKYDKSLVESWKSDMEGMLIFAGLFSASLTAFLVESYKSLNSDSSDDTVRLLNQISQQLAASAKGTTFDIPPAPSFAPPASALACNMFWFISLSLSLSCALIATLVEQWARDFIHRTEIQSPYLLLLVLRAERLQYAPRRGALAAFAAYLLDAFLRWLGRFPRARQYPAGCGNHHYAG
ncbi:hypothetical protein R3P38DRAFT_3297686 [Favolaschia claudopus]|uniref:DUF6535 domain-containing protein n=1 Tax=Favolaschia claudopus TaxID=2862362 RepID=A0AAV9Z5G8_9AGAR